MTVRKYDPDDYVRGEYVEFNYPESIPLSVRGRPIVWPRSAHVGGLFNFHCSWDILEIPTKFQNLLCYGSIPTNVDKHSKFDKRRGIVICGDCDKPKVYNSHWCLNCGEFFIRDFVDTRFCPAYPHCFNCLDVLRWDYCPDHAMPQHVEWAENGDTTIIRPVGLNPKNYSREELDSVFDF